MMRESTAEIKAALLNDLSGLLHTLFPHKPIVWRKGEWRIGTHGSLSVRADGCWYNHEAGAGGDILDIVAFAQATDFKGALEFSKSYVGGRIPSTLAKRPVLQLVQSESRAKQQAKARNFWQQCTPMGGADAAR